jgi:hypothetical protein
MEIDPHQEITILFIAHNGIVNSRIWEEWITLTPDYARINVTVFVNNNPQYANNLTMNNDLGIRMPTAWCSFGIVDATIESLQASKELYPNSTMFYVVSGACIPTKHPSVLLQNSQNYFYKIPSKPTKKAIGVSWLVDNWFEHRQFFCLRSDDTQTLVSWYRNPANTERLNIMKQVHEQSKPILSYTKNRIPVAGPQPGALYNACADEWVIGTILKLNRISLKNYQITAQYYPPVTDTPSPVQFTSLNVPVELDAGDNNATYWSLQEILQEKGYTHEPFFIRKVALSEQDQLQIIPVLRMHCWKESTISKKRGHDVQQNTKEPKLKSPRRNVSGAYLGDLIRRVDHIESYLESQNRL